MDKVSFETITMRTVSVPTRRYLGMSSKRAAKRMLDCLEDDSLLRMLIEICRDYHVTGTPHFKTDQADVNELIREILYRMHNGSKAMEGKE